MVYKPVDFFNRRGEISSWALFPMPHRGRGWDTEKEGEGGAKRGKGFGGPLLLTLSLSRSQSASRHAAESTARGFLHEKEGKIPRTFGSWNAFLNLENCTIVELGNTGRTFPHSRSFKSFNLPKKKEGRSQARRKTVFSFFGEFSQLQRRRRINTHLALPKSKRSKLYSEEKEKEKVSLIRRKIRGEIRFRGLFILENGFSEKPKSVLFIFLQENLYVFQKKNYGNILTFPTHTRVFGS